MPFAFLSSCSVPFDLLNTCQLNERYFDGQHTRYHSARILRSAVYLASV